MPNYFAWTRILPIFALKFLYCCVSQTKSCEQGEFPMFQFDNRQIGEDISIYYEGSVKNNVIQLSLTKNFVSYFKLDEIIRIPTIPLEQQQLCTSNLGFVKTVDKFWDLLSVAKNGPTSSTWFILAEFDPCDTNGPNQTLFNLDEFKIELANQLIDSTFYQQNFLLLYLKLMWSNGTTEFVIFTIYRIDTIASPLVIRQIPLEEEFCIHNPIPIRYTIMSSFRPDFFGTELNVVGVNLPWYSYDTKFRKISKSSSFADENYEFESGYTVEILFGMRDLLNFKIKARTTDTWGNPDINKIMSWNGMIGDIRANKSDLGISSTANVGPRVGAVDFNIPCNLIRVSAFFKRVTGFDANSNAILMPFTLNLWIAVVVWILFNYICYKIFLNYFIQQISAPTTYSSSPHLNDCQGRLEVIVSVICMKGLKNPPKLTGIRYFYLCELIVAVILYAAYSGILISFLSVENNLYKSLDKLLSTDYKFYMRSASARAYLKTSPVDVHREIYKRTLLIEIVTHSDQKKFANKLLAGRFVFVADHLSASIARSVMSPIDSCEIQEIQLPMAFHRLGSIVKSGSKIGRIIDWSIIKMMETGNIHLWNQRNLMIVPKCDSSSQHSTSIVSDLPDVLLAFKILSGTITTAILILLIEILLSRMRC